MGAKKNVGLFVATLLINSLVFLNKSNLPYAFIPLPALALAAYFGGAGWAILGILATAAIATTGTLLELGPFGVMGIGLVPLELFIISVAIATMAIAILKEESEREHECRVEVESEKRLQSKYARELEYALETQRLTIRAAHHNMRGPLTTIAAFATEIKGGELKEWEVKENIDYIISQAKHQIALTESWGAYETLGRESLNFVSIDIGKMLDMIEAGIPGSELLRINKMPVIVADRAMIYQLFENIIENAFKYGAERVVVEYTDEADYDRFTISDDGMGIDPKYHDKVFEAFERLHHASEYPGMGMGLALSKRIVELHRGNITLISDGKGQGCTFEFTIQKRGSGEGSISRG